MARKRKPGKWSNLDGKLPKHDDTVELTPRVEEILRRRDARRDKTMQELVDEWDALAAKDAEAVAAQADRNITYDALEKLMLEQIEHVKAVSGQEQWRDRDGRPVSPKRTLYPKVTDKAKLREWVEEHDMEDLLELPSGRLNAAVAEAYDSDQVAMLTPAQRATLTPGMPGSLQAPPGVEVYIKTSINRTTRGGAAQSTEEEP